MDTRTKILTPEAAAAIVEREGARLIVVTGYFDLLLARHVRELRAVRGRTVPGPLMLVLLPPARPVFEPPARAEMASALGMVDYVVTGEADRIRAFLASLPAPPILCMEAAEEGWIEQLIEHVHRRQRS